VFPSSGGTGDSWCIGNRDEKRKRYPRARPGNRLDRIECAHPWRRDEFFFTRNRCLCYYMPMPFREHASKLVQLESFDSSAFVGNAEWPQEVCNLVLSLALVYNDFRDVILGHALLKEVEPDDTVNPSQELGLYNGLRNNLIRIQSGMVNELLVLIRDHRQQVSAPPFQRLVRQLSRDGRMAWKGVVDVATARTSSNPLAKILVLVRNKVAFHYSPEELANGYRSAFVTNRTHGEPLLSRGRNLMSTRFYFADASVQAYMLDRAQDQTAMAFLLGSGPLLSQMNLALYELVTRFIQARGAAWHPMLT
jgi:hypothetical protein